MKFCAHCGKELLDEAVVCPGCGCSTGNGSNKSNSGLLIAAKVFMILNIALYLIIAGLFLILLSSGTGDINAIFNSYGYTIPAGVNLSPAIALIFLIPLLWVVPMTLSLSRKIKNNEPVSIAFKICTLLFVGLIPGILLLCARDDSNN